MTRQLMRSRLYESNCRLPVTYFTGKMPATPTADSWEWDQALTVPQLILSRLKECDGEDTTLI